MNEAFFKLPTPVNEPVSPYAPGDKARTVLEAELKAQRSNRSEIPLVIGGEHIRTGQKHSCIEPHRHSSVIAECHMADEKLAQKAIDAAVKAQKTWQAYSWQDRAAIMLKAADLLTTKYRAKVNAATMLGQSKNAFQAEIDSACEMIDFFRFNAAYLTKIYSEQPDSAPGMWNRMEYRPLEGFIFAVTPFNFTSIAGNLPTACALMGNTVVWKPSHTALPSAWALMQLLEESGMPPGVINFLPGPSSKVADPILKHKDFAGIHFTGSTSVFQNIWQTIGNNIANYRSYPRIVGETGGKDFVFAHHEADAAAVATALVRGAFEYQGQKCSAASRAYIARSIWPKVKQFMGEQLSEIKMGDVTDFSNFVNAVIDEKSFDKLTGAISRASKSSECKIVFGGKSNKEVGYFVEPTVIETTNPHYETMLEELFGPVLTVYIYDDTKFEETLSLCDTSAAYALTGAFFSQNRSAIITATEKLRNAAGNFYINDKPTGAVVGQQPFGGGRASGTNDKAGSMLNLIRWTSPRAIKETFNPPTNYRYPFLGK